MNEEELRALRRERVNQHLANPDRVPFLKPDEIAERMGISPAYLRQIRSGKPPNPSRKSKQRPRGFTYDMARKYEEVNELSIGFLDRRSDEEAKSHPVDPDHADEIAARIRRLPISLRQIVMQTLDSQELLLKHYPELKRAKNAEDFNREREMYITLQADMIKRNQKSQEKTQGR